MKTHLTLLSVALISFTAFSKPLVIKEKGKPLEIRWEDGRIARYAVHTSNLWAGDIPFQISENSCSTKAPHCHFKSYLKMKLPVLYWEKHPDPVRVGKIVKGKPLTEGPEFLLHFPYFLNLDQRITKQAIASDLPTDEIVCDHFDWLPLEKPATVPEKYTVPRWNVEAMRLNPETGLTENRIIGGGINVDLEKMSPTSLGIMRASSMFGPTETLVQGDILAWILPKPTGGYCQLSIKADVTTVNTELLGIYYAGLANSKWDEYLWESDAFSSTFYPMYFDVLFANPDGWNAL